MYDPLVSVVVTAYNLGWCIEDALESVFAQTYPKLEVIVVDDASTDDTASRLQRYAGRILNIRHETNQGLATNAEAGPSRNTGIRAASGQYVAILDGDDLWEPEKIAEQVAAARRFPEAGLIVTDGASFNHENGAVLRDTLLLDRDDRYFRSLPRDAVVVEDLYRHVIRGCVFDTPSQVMIPVRVFAEVGLFAECRSDDYDFYLRAARRYPIAIVKKCLVRYRQHQSNMSGAMEGRFLHFVQPNLDIWYRHLDECRPDSKALLHAQIRRHLVDAADRAAALAQAGEPAPAAQFLARLLSDNPPGLAASYVGYQRALLRSPGWLRSALWPITRRARRLLRGAA